MKRVISQVSLIVALCMTSMLVYGQKGNNNTITTRTQGKTIKHIKRVPFNSNGNKSNGNCSPSSFRTINGTCNNLSDPDRCEWGATDIALFRALPAQYGTPDSLNSIGGQERKSPREISNILCEQTAPLESIHNLSSLVFTWGQFLDHDIGLTPEGETEYTPIELPADEPLFTVPMPFLRSEIHEGTGETNQREHTNLLTSWIDGSNVYGSDTVRANWLRTFVDGKLRTSSNNLLPYNTIDGEEGSAIDPTAPSMAGDDDGTTVVFVAGDVRANEQPGLTALHTLFMREHNRICDELLADGVTGDELIYQMARKRVGAKIQTITYEEFLPALGVELSPYTGYDPAIRPDIMNVFSAAAYRVGHTMVTDEILMLDDSCNAVANGSLSLLEGFFNPTQIATHGLEPFLKGLSVQVQREIDLKVIDNLRDFLFGDPNSPMVFGLDLASLNIQRGRDHGLPDYKTIREHFTGQNIQDFSDITSDTNKQNALNLAYDGDINNIDAWVGMLAEDQLFDKSIGVTLFAIMQQQFEKLRDGDFFYYENILSYNSAEMQEIQGTTLAQVIMNNTDLNSIQANAFVSEGCTNDCPVAGTACDDADANTFDDIEDGDCNCAGTPAALVSMRVFLQGAVEPGGLMTDQLRTLGFLPTTEPYTEMINFEHTGAGGGEVVDPSVFSQTGDDAIVDWLFLEVRDENNPTTLITTCAALIQRDGDVVATDGVSPARLAVQPGNYYIAARHRNHLGVMTAETVDLLTNNTASIDFSDSATATWGTNAQMLLESGTYAMWAGNTDGGKQIIFQGGDNDCNKTFFDVMSADDNTAIAPNYILGGYYDGDVNLNSQTIYQGNGNDANIIFFNIITHPENTTQISNFIINQQLP